MEREAILNALEECLWVQARAARKLGITERMIGYKIKKYDIKIKEVDDGDAKVSRGKEETNHSSSINK